MNTQAHTKPLQGADYSTIPMVSVAQLVERRTVNAKVAGSSPVGHPKVSPMSLLSHYDRTWMCNHNGMLAKAKPNGARLCIRCGTIVQLVASADTFTSPINFTVDGLDTKRIPR